MSDKKQAVMSALISYGFETDTYLEFDRHMSSGHQRLGQAFYNALDRSDQEVLMGTRFDPHSSDEVSDVLLAIAFLRGEA